MRALAAGYKPEPRCVELHALRRAHATTRDYTVARSLVEARHKREAEAAAFRQYTPPPRLAQFFSGRPTSAVSD